MRFACAARCVERADGCAPCALKSPPRLVMCVKARRTDVEAARRMKYVAGSTRAGHRGGRRHPFFGRRRSMKERFPGIEVGGVSIGAVIDAFAQYPSIVNKYLIQYGLGSKQGVIDRSAWYSLDKWLAV